MKEISIQEYCEILDIDRCEIGLPTYESISKIICHAIDRWRVAPKIQLLNHLKRILSESGFHYSECKERVNEVYKHAVLLGMIEEVSLGGQTHCMKSKLRWVRITEDLAVVTGTTTGLNISLIPSDGNSHPLFSLIPKFDPNKVENIAVLQDLGVTEWTVREWQGEFGFIDYMTRRKKIEESPTIIDFWNLLNETITEEGLLLSEDAEIRIVRGEPGTYFGRHNSQNEEGRWTSSSEDGTWCGVRKGYQENHWRPCIVRISDDQRLVLDLFDFEEWNWALLARGISQEKPEIFKREGDTLSFTFPVPNHLKRLMFLVSNNNHKWNWDIPSGLDSTLTISSAYQAL